MNVKITIGENPEGTVSAHKRETIEDVRHEAFLEYLNDFKESDDVLLGIYGVEGLIEMGNNRAVVRIYEREQLEKENELKRWD